MSATDILVLAESHADGVTDMTLELLAAARQLAGSTGGKVVAVLLSEDGASRAAALAAADRILAVDDPLLAAYSPQPYLAVLEAVIGSESPRAVLFGSTTIGLDVAPALGARLGVPVLNGCQVLEAAGDVIRATCSLCAGKLLADVQVRERSVFAVVLPGAFRATQQQGEGKLESVPSPMPLEAGPIRFEEMVLPEAGDVDITQEDILVSVGRGIQQEDNLEVAEELAQALGGQLCASRPIIDQGWLPTTRQVGKSGMVVHPKLYLALGVSGAPEHVEGMKDSELIIAVNTDAAAPIFDVAQFGVQMDLLDVVPPLVEALKKRNGAG